MVWQKQTLRWIPFFGWKRQHTLVKDNDSMYHFLSHNLMIVSQSHICDFRVSAIDILAPSDLLVYAYNFQRHFERFFGWWWTRIKRCITMMNQMMQNTWCHIWCHMMHNVCKLGIFKTTCFMIVVSSWRTVVTSSITWSCRFGSVTTPSAQGEKIIIMHCIVDNAFFKLMHLHSIYELMHPQFFYNLMHVKYFYNFMLHIYASF